MCTSHRIRVSTQLCGWRGMENLELEEEGERVTMGSNNRYEDRGEKYRSLG